MINVTIKKQQALFKKNNLKSLKLLILFLIVYSSILKTSAQNTYPEKTKTESKATIDPQILELIESFKSQSASGNLEKAKELKSEILEIAKHAYPDKLDDINKLLETSQASQPKPTTESYQSNKAAIGNVKKDVITFTINNESYCAIKAPLDRFNGTYKYPGKEARFWQYEQGEPIVELGPDQKGRFQSHGVPPLAVTWWIESDCQGKIQILNGVLADRYILVIRYEESGSHGYPAKGSFDRMSLDIYKNSNRMVILGEREKN